MSVDGGELPGAVVQLGGGAAEHFLLSCQHSAGDTFYLIIQIWRETGRLRHS